MIKITSRLLLILGLLLVLAASHTSDVSAAIQVTESEVLLIVDYDNLKEDDKFISVTTGQFTIQNDGASNVTAKITASNLPSDYTFTFKDDVNVVDVPANSSVLQTFTINISHDKDSGEENIGTITVEEVGGASSDTLAIKQKTLPMLVIDEIQILYRDEDNKQQDKDFNYDRNDPDSIDWTLDKEVLVGTKVEITFNLENMFNSKYDDGDIDNIELRFEVNDDDLYEENIDETYDLNDINADGNDKLVITFMIAADADTDTYTFDITLEGEDGQGVTHKIEKELQLEITRKRDDVRIVQADLVPASITACDAGFSLDVELQNLGTRDQDFVTFIVDNEALSINENIADIQIEQYDDRDNSWSRLFNFDLDGVAGGTYYLDLKVFYNRDKESDSELLRLDLKPCAEEPPVEPEEPEQEEQQQEQLQVTAGTSGDNDTPDAETTEKPVTSSPVIQTTESSLKSDDLIVAGIVVLIVLLAGIVALFVAVLVKK